MQRPHTQPLARLLAMLLLGTLLLVVAAPVFAADGGSDRGWGAFFGRMHVVILHLPIGLIIGAFALEALGFFKRSKGYDVAAAWMFILGALASIPAVITGLLLASEKAVKENVTPTVWQVMFASDDFNISETMGWHLWAGIIVMVAAIAAAALKVLAVRKQWGDDDAARGGWPLAVSRFSLLGAMAILPLAGHLGGNMTHGRQFLFERSPIDVPEWVINFPPEHADDLANDGEEQFGTAQIAWDKKIQPQLNAHCIACHGPDDQSGGLRLDSLQWVMEAEAIEAGDAGFSPLYNRIALPASHPEYMPPPKKIDAYGQLTLEEVAFIGQWIQDFDGTVEKPTVTESQADADNGSAQTAAPRTPAVDLEALAAAGASAQLLSQDVNADMVAVSFAYLSDLSPETVAKLKTGADKIAQLTFEGSAFGDESAKALPEMDSLARLNLKDTAITDAGLAELPEFFSLTWLNLFGTAVTDAGLAELEKYDLLEKLYLTGTEVTAEGVEELRKALPDTEIFSDYDSQFQFTPVVPDVLPADPVEEAQEEQDAQETHVPAEPAPAAATMPVNTACPVSGAPAKPEFVSTFEGKAVGFCCNNCKGQFDADPQKFATKLQ